MIQQEKIYPHTHSIHSFDFKYMKKSRNSRIASIEENKRLLKEIRALFLFI